MWFLLLVYPPADPHRIATDPHRIATDPEMDEQIYAAIGELYLQSRLELRRLKEQARAAIDEQKCRADNAENLLAQANERAAQAEKARDEALHLLMEKNKGEKN